MNTHIVLLLLGLLSSQAGAALRQEENTTAVVLQPSASALASQITPAMQRWREAVTHRNLSELPVFTWPDERTFVRAELQNRRSALWKILFGPSHSVCEFLRSSDVQIAVFDYADDGSHRAATSCFYRGAIAWPRTYSALHKLSDRQNVFCLDWNTYQNGDVYVSYGFAYPRAE